MRQRRKEVRIEYELTDQPITALGGFPIVIEAAKAFGIDHLFDKYLHVKVRNRGYTEYELAKAVILTLIAGGAKALKTPIKSAWTKWSVADASPIPPPSAISCDASPKKSNSKRCSG